MEITNKIVERLLKIMRWY